MGMSNEKKFSDLDRRIQNHAFSVHGDRGFYEDCDQCNSLAEESFALFRIDPQDKTDAEDAHTNRIANSVVLWRERKRHGLTAGEEIWK